MKKNYLSILLISFFCNVKAQQWEWARKADATTSQQKAIKICSDTFDNIFVLGNNSGNAIYGMSILDSGNFIVKYNSYGSLQWAINTEDKTKDIATDSYGNLFVLGDTLTSNFHIIKYNSLGSLIWKKSFPGNGFALAVNPTGNIYVTGDNNVLFFLVKIDSLGIMNWLRSIPNDSTRSYNRGYLLYLDKKENIYVALDGGFYPHEYGSGQWLAKYDSTGNLIDLDPRWQFFEDVSQLVADENSNTYSISNYGSHYGYDPALVKFDSTNTRIWFEYTGDFYTSSFDQGLSRDSLGNFFVAGAIGADFTPDSGDSVQFPDSYHWVHVNGYSDLGVVKYDSSGNYQWIKTAGGKNYELSSDMCMDRFGNMYVTGNFNVTYNGSTLFDDTAYFDNQVLINDGTWQQMFVAKLNPSATITTTQSQIQSLKSEFSLFPNPTHSLLNIECKTPNAQLKIYNPYGSLIHQQILTSANQQIDLSAQPRGIYFLEIESGEKREMRKIVLN